MHALDRVQHATPNSARILLRLQVRFRKSAIAAASPLSARPDPAGTECPKGGIAPAASSGSAPDEKKCSA